MPGTSVLRPGDRLDIKLGLDSQSREVATFIWANFVKVEGVVGARAAERWVTLHPSSGDALFARVDADTRFLGGARIEDLRRGRPVIVIGERLDERRVRASRIVMARQ